MLSCTEENKTSSSTDEKIVAIDTLVISTDVSKKVAGNAYLSRATEYGLLIDKDTSNMSFVFLQNKDYGTVGIDFNQPYNAPKSSHRQRFSELSYILPYAAKDYPLDSLRGFSLGRLVGNGDLAIAVSQQIDSTLNIEDYKEVSKFLMQSALAKEINNLLAPYSISVKSISVEKVFFTDKKEVYTYSLIESDSSVIPNKILDCLLWVNVGK